MVTVGRVVADSTRKAIRPTFKGAEQIEVLWKVPLRIHVLI